MFVKKYKSSMHADSYRQIWSIDRIACSRDGNVDHAQTVLLIGRFGSLWPNHLHHLLSCGYVGWAKHESLASSDFTFLFYFLRGAILPFDGAAEFKTGEKVQFTNSSTSSASPRQHCCPLWSPSVFPFPPYLFTDISPSLISSSSFSLYIFIR